MTSKMVERNRSVSLPKVIAFLLAFLVPTRAVRFHVFSVFDLRPFDFIGILSVVWFVFEVFKKRKFQWIRSKEVVAFGVFILTSLVSSIFSVIPVVSLVRVLISIFLFVVALSLSLMLRSDDGVALWFSAGLIAGAVLSFVPSVMETFFHKSIHSFACTPFVPSLPYWRATGFMKDPNYFSFYLSSAFVLLVVMRVAGVIRGSLFGILSLILLLNIFITFSRTSVIFIIVGILFVSLFIKRDIFELNITYRFKLLILVLIIVFIAIFILRSSYSIKDFGYLYSFNYRLTAWSEALNTLTKSAQRIIWGFGPFSSKKVINLYTHNLIVNLLFERGVLGLLPFAWFVYETYKGSLGLIVDRWNKYYWISVAGLGVYTSYLFVGLLFDVLYEPLFWLSFGLIFRFGGSADRA